MWARDEAVNAPQKKLEGDLKVLSVVSGKKKYFETLETRSDGSLWVFGGKLKK